MLANPSFEQPWFHPSEAGTLDGWHYLAKGEAPIDEIQNPPGWELRWADQSMPDNPYFDGHDWSKLVRPEQVHKSRTELPEHEWGLFILDGEWTYKLFAKQAWASGMSQSVKLEPGVYRLTVRCFADLVKGYDDDDSKIWAEDPVSGNVRFLIGDQATDWIHLTAGQVNEQWMEFGVQESTSIRLGFDFLLPYALKSNAIFLDHITLELVKEPDPEPDPEPPECRGKPREQYQRTYILLPQSAEVEWWTAAAEFAHENENTVGSSADDAGIGDLDYRRIIAINPQLVGDGLTQEWYDEFYPGVEFIPVTVDEPGSLKSAILSKLSGTDDPPPPEEPVDPPPGTSWLAIHQLVNQPEGMADFQAIGPRLFKAVDRSDQIIAAYNMTPDEVKPHIRLFFRKWRADEGGLRYASDFPAVATDWIEYVAGNMLSELYAKDLVELSSQIVILGPNEVWEHDIQLNQLTIDLDLEMIKALAAFNGREKTQFSYAAASMAVGNPKMPHEEGGEEQWTRILPLAKVLRDYTGNGLGAHNCFNYHAYGLCNADHPEWLVEHGPYLQHRWMAYYDWLADHGAAVPFFHGEGGHCDGTVYETAERMGPYSQISVTPGDQLINVPGLGLAIMLRKSRTFYPPRRPRGMTTANAALNPGRGWVGVIDWPRAEQELLDEFDEKIEMFNRKHKYEASFGLTMFQAGNTSDWALFDYQGEPLRSLARALKAKYA